VVNLIGRVPVRGELVRGPDSLEFQVLDADPRRVKRIRIYRRAGQRVEREARRRDGEGGRGGAVIAATASETGAAGEPQEGASTRDAPPP
jgi:hypothetical protein